MNLNKKEIKKYLNKFWYFVWKDDSWKGWIFSIIFLFIFIKLIFFPGLSLITGTSLPLAIVESCSMHHEGIIFHNYNSWFDNHKIKYEKFDLEKDIFNNFIFKNGFTKGDILLIVGVKPEKLKVGDVIIFNAGKKNPIIHRLVKITQENNEYVFSTIGDNNWQQLSFEIRIKENQLVGKAVFKILPYFGWGKLIFFESMRSSSERGFCNEN
jgi:hypothetical protein